MKKLLELIEEEVTAAFEAAGYDGKYGHVSLSNRPDLCEYQCNGALAAAKQYKKAPLSIAADVAKLLEGKTMFAAAEVCPPGFLNLTMAETFLADYVNEMAGSPRLGIETATAPGTIMIDYGGPNVAKPLHVGHLRSAIIGESIKRIARFMGNEVIGDVHLGDWGLQMGLIITELHERQPELVYFDADYQGEYPKEAPFTIGELEEIYPTASARSKTDEAYKEAAMAATYEMQNGNRGYQALLQHILQVSVTDLKKNYENLSVSFELWKGESDAQPYIPGMVEKMKEDGYAYISEGALVVDVAEDTDTKEVPPCMILKSDGAALYNTTDLATLVWRMEDYHPHKVIYVVDKRQELHFVQVFRCARKTGIVPPDTELEFIGFGTMNGKDGKPFKTRDGGVMRLETLVAQINDRMYEKIMENATMSQEEARHTAQIVALSAIKYGDLSNQASKDYIFDVERFTSFEGNTGPYILYTIVRMKSILAKYESTGKQVRLGCCQPAGSAVEKALMLELAKFQGALWDAYAETAPHKLCSYIYDLANAFNRFYHETRIMSEEDGTKQAGYIGLLALTKQVLETCIDLLGFEAPERM
jgi:arginyl-tRNA synthetase